MQLSFSRVSFSYPGASTPAVSDLQFTLGPGWTGIVGANGSGKTTLLRLALGDLEPTAGRVIRPSLSRYCAQRTDDPPDGWLNVLAPEDSSGHRLFRVLGLDAAWARRWHLLSHGERKRVQAAVALSGRPECLAADEPTNHLDRETRARVVEALGSFRGIGLLVSHDRDLLDALCSRCLFLEDGRAVLRPGGYTQGAREAARERATRTADLAAASTRVSRLRAEYATRREHAARGERQRSKRDLPRRDHDGRQKIDAARVADGGSGSRLRQLDGRIRQAEHAADSLRVTRQYSTGVTLDGECARRPVLLHVPASDIRLGDTGLLRLPSLVVRPDDRIGIQGANGTGKSTLVRQLVASLTERSVPLVYIPQEMSAEESGRVLAGFKSQPPEALGRAMTLVRRLGSDPVRLLQSREPSPGELRKLLLAEGIESRPHVIVLDEPTNHLDLPSVECLESALVECAAALLLVSHDSRFLSRLVTRWWRIERDGDRWRLEDSGR